MDRQKTRWVLVASLTLITASLPSCKKGCYKCTSSYDTNIVCEDDYDTHKQFKDALDHQAAFGYTCKK